MPYEWSSSDGAPDAMQTLHLWPHRSLPRRGFAGFILITAALISVPLFPLLGTVVLWGVLPFLMLAVGGVWFALERSYRDGRLHEELTISVREIHLTRTSPNGRLQEWECESYWARAQMHETGGPVPNYVTLSGKGREVEIGAFLSEDERVTLFEELTEMLVKIAKRGSP
ncbi:MAG: DUF2244 domain-containing protein [Pseudomonadota bacterium]